MSAFASGSSEVRIENNAAMLDSSGVELDRRREPREPISGTLWLIDNQNSRIIRCQCSDASPNGMRLRLPAGYGVQVGARYQLSSQLPGQSAPPGLNLVLSRGATVVRANVLADCDAIDVGVALASRRQVDWKPAPGVTVATRA